MTSPYAPAASDAGELVYGLVDRLDGLQSPLTDARQAFSISLGVLVAYVANADLKIEPAERVAFDQIFWQDWREIDFVKLSAELEKNPKFIDDAIEQIEFVMALFASSEPRTSGPYCAANDPCILTFEAAARTMLAAGGAAASERHRLSETVARLRKRASAIERQIRVSPPHKSDN